MAKTVWPITSELTSRLTGLGVSATPTGIALQDMIDMAVEQASLQTGRQFIVDAADVEKVFDPPYTEYLDLKGDWNSVTSVEIGDTTLTIEEDYWLVPPAAPHTSVTLASHWTLTPQTVTVTGKRGIGIPTAVWLAVLDYAAAMVLQTSIGVGSSVAGPVTEIKQDSVTLKYGSGSSSSGGSAGTLAEQLKASAEDVFKRYQRLSVGGY